jgi:hypothetical protein
MRLHRTIAIAFSLALAMPAFADTVPGTADIWLAGQPDGTQVMGPFGTDTATQFSPILVTVTGAYVTFTATGTTSVNNGNCYAGPAGGCYSDESGDSDDWGQYYNGPASALVGVFTDGTAPALYSMDGYTGPQYVDGPDYQNPVNTAPGVYSPSLDQIFIIGTGATNLYLGVADALGASGDNLGSLSVTESFTATQPEINLTPEPGSLTLLGTGILGAAAIVRRRAASMR